MKKIVMVLVLLINSSILKGEDCYAYASQSGYDFSAGGFNCNPGGTQSCSGGQCVFYGGMGNSCEGGQCKFRNGPVTFTTSCGKKITVPNLVDPCYSCSGGLCS